MDYYEELGLSRSASGIDINKAYVLSLRLNSRVTMINSRVVDLVDCD
jgi:hypothetical protein|tara:strand:- start:4007 stop:4147 length:141 start_codon:yes stop_codon:yes gene_type:complete